ncbi:phospholipid carrier-dependent glycosyltransferase [Pendulispora albinea]|uniref:Phospholipid carrier-dependent glycosyltransferase n=1 Tax=Pendulispora albinea TaxID=2741071 RepID=A0ABZ2M4I8_9BACT
MIVPLCAMALVALQVLRFHAWLFSQPVLVHARDEGYIAAFALRMLEGRMLPYVDAVSQRGPLLYYGVAWMGHLFDPLTWMPVRAMSVLAIGGSLTATSLAAWLARRPLTAAVAALAGACVYFISMEAYDALGLSGEHLLNAFLLAAFCCLVVALRRERHVPSPGWLFAAGALTSCAALSKHFGLVGHLPFGLWVLAAAWREGAPPRARRVAVGAYAAGAVIPIAALLVRYAAASELGALHYWLIVYTRDIYMAPLDYPGYRAEVYRQWLVHNILAIGAGLTLAASGFTRLLTAAPLATPEPRSLRDRVRDRVRASIRAYDEHGFVLCASVMAVIGILVCNATLRGFPHYAIVVVPWCGLLLGEVVTAHLGESPRGGVRVLAQVLVLVPGAALFLLGSSQLLARYRADQRADRLWLDDRYWTDAQLRQMCAEMDPYARRGERIFVWGFAPVFYVGCGRRPATRYLMTTYPSGFVPWFRATKAEDDARAVPGSRAQLLADLETTKPRVILDVPSSMDNRSMDHYETLGAYLHEHYCRGKTVLASTLYARRTDEGACPPGTEP